jgi:hypothetical protein
MGIFCSERCIVFIRFFGTQQYSYTFLSSLEVIARNFDVILRHPIAYTSFQGDEHDCGDTMSLRFFYIATKLCGKSSVQLTLILFHDIISY